MIDTHSSPHLAPALQLYEDGRHRQALETWRDLKVRQFRSMPFGEVAWHASYVSDLALDASRWLVGGEGTAIIDTWGLRGKPGETGPINWVAEFEVKGGQGANYGWWRGPYTDLVGAWYRTHEEIFLQKWFEVTADFHLNQQRMMAAVYDPAEPDSPYGVFRCNWNHRDFASTLFQSYRAEFLLHSLAYVSKTLSPEDADIPWDEIGEPNHRPLTDEEIALIPAREFAIISMALMADYPEALFGRYVTGGAIPNQKNHGLTMLTKLAISFDEFARAAHIEEVVDPAWVEFVDTALFHEDGANREYSFNYNPGVLKAIFSLVLMDGDGQLPNWLERAKAYAQQYRLVQASLIMGSGVHPQVGNAAMLQPRKLWDPEELREYRRQLSGGTHVSPQLEGRAEHPLVEQISATMLGRDDDPPAFTSVAFPYAGFYLMRDSWSLADGVSLFFSGSYKSSGHGNADAGGIQLAAYGRSLLVYGGLPTYGMAGSIDWPRELHSYLDEDSSYKTNSVLVDGLVQARAEKADSPLHIPWYTSDHFDFVERRYEGGYRLQEHRRPAEGQVDTSVTHTRSLFFIRQAAAWIVVDRLENSGPESHTYSQVWNFLPNVEEDDGRGTVYGFDLQDIHTDDAAHRISTAQAGAPNVALHHFSPDADVMYRTYYEETERYLVPFSEERREVYLGWFARHIEDRLGAADVHAAWRGKPGSTSVLVTAIVPSRTEQSRVIEALDTSKDGIAGCLLTLKGGDLIGFSSSYTDDAALNVLDHQLTARSLLVYQPQEGEERGISIDAEGGAEFVGSGMTEVGVLQVPAGFTWRQTDSGFVPEYDY